jgi:hypothetical protein
MKGVLGGRALLPSLACAVVLLASPSHAAKVPKTGPLSLVDAPHTDADPVMDGAATSFEEWTDGVAYPDLFGIGRDARAGWYWLEQREDWEATSVATSDASVLSGRTLFVAHDITGSADARSPLYQFRVQEDADWNSFSFPTPRGVVTIWVFANGNAADDSDWLDAAEGLAASGLAPEGTGPDLIDDRGFIARLDGDPASDRHWFPGDPEPGDAGWDPEVFYGCFGRASFGQSFQDVGLDLNPADAVPHEVYEFCCTYPPDEPPDESVWFEVVVLKVDDRIVRLWVLRGDLWLHFWEPPPFIPTGRPPVRDRFDQMGQRLQSIAYSVSVLDPDAGKAVNFAAQSFFDVFTAIGENDARGAFDHNEAGLRSALEASRAGYTELLRNDMVHSLAGAQDKVLTEILTLDLSGGSLPPSGGLTGKSSEDPSVALRKAYKALGSAGKKLAKIRESGGAPSGQWVAALKLYRKAFNALTGDAAGR